MVGYYEETCANCNNIFKRRIGQHPKYKVKHRVKSGQPSSWTGKHFCSQKCTHAFYDQKVTQPCEWCNKPVTRKQADLRKSKSGMSFCNQSCAASHHNTERRRSIRSKSEKLLFELLVAEFPKLTIIANDKKMLDGYEVDVGMPTINLAVEWNGIVHFKPIYGQTKLTKIQQRDAEKQKIAQTKGINLIVIPDLVSKDKYVHEAFQNIKKIINGLL